MTTHTLPYVVLATSLLVPFASGCKKKSSSRQEAAAYTVGNPGGGWTSQSGGTADRAWYHPKLSASIYTDAACGARYEDGELPDLATHLTFGVATGEPSVLDITTLAGRSAHVRVQSGSLDGIAVRVGVAVVKKHDCLYDLLYIAPPATFEQGWPAFERVFRGLDVGRG